MIITSVPQQNIKPFTVAPIHPAISKTYQLAISDMTRFYTKMLSVLLFLSVIHIRHASAQYYPLNDTDENGCGIGEEFRGGSCKLCRPGTYRFLGPKHIPTQDPRQCLIEVEQYPSKIEDSSTRCLPCPGGTYNPYHGASRYKLCHPCPIGTTSGEGARRCQKCVPGKSSALGSSQCVSCPKGFFLTKPCAKGHAPDTACTKCPIGTYATARNSATCAKCPQGTSTSRRGATSKDMCKRCGTMGVRCSCQESGEPWTAVGSYRPIGESGCTRCPPGTRAKTPFAISEEECVPCPDGTFFLYKEGCKKCGPGEKSFGIGASNCRKNRDDGCPNDSFKDKSGVCKLCPVGYKKEGLECIRCPPGTASQGYTSTRCDKCTFPRVVSPNEDSCICGHNHFWDIGKTYDCLPCPKGTKMKNEFHSTSECELDCENFPNLPGCKPCKEDYERNQKTGECRQCKPGLRSLVGEELCVDPKTGCPEGFEFKVSAYKFGIYLVCIG